MGNCTQIERQSIRKSIKQIQRPAGNKQLSININTMPFYPVIKSTQLHSAKSRELNLDLIDHSTIKLTIQTFLPEQKVKWNQQQMMKIEHNFEVICSFRKQNRAYMLEFPFTSEQDCVYRYIWHWTDFNIGDIMKIGKTKYKLCQLVKSHKQNKYAEVLSTNQTSLISHSQENICKICFSSHSSLNDPLISPCKCAGSVKYVHQKCLKQWIFSIQSKQNPQEQSPIIVKKSMCQLCKTEFAQNHHFDKIKNELINQGQQQQTPYAVFESYHQELPNRKNYFRMSFANKNKYTLGRSHKADIKDTSDSCISKINTQIKFTQGRLMIRDCDSTHGTQMYIKGQLTLNKQNPEEHLIYKNIFFRTLYQPQYNGLGKQ